MTAATILLLAAVLAAASPVAVYNRELPRELDNAQDIRWAGPDSVLVSAGRAGVFQVPLNTKNGPPRRVIGAEEGTGFFFSSRLAASDRYLVVASPFGAFGVRSRAVTEKAVKTHPMSITMDIDVDGDRIAVLGGNRDEHHVWASDGAVAWLGRIHAGDVSLTPLVFSKSGPGAMTMAMCHMLETGAVRFLPDHSVVVVPGVEEGVYQYDATGRLERTWPTTPLSFVDHCSLSKDEFQLLAANGVARAAWVNGHRVLDDVVPVNGGPGLIVRSWDGHHVTWQLITLVENGRTTEKPLAFSSPSPYTHLRADVRGSRAAFLLFDFQPAADTRVHAARVVVADLP